MSPLAFRFDYGRESPVVSSLTFGFLGHLWPCRPCPSALSAMFGYVDLGLRLWHEDRPFCPRPSALDAKTESHPWPSAVPSRRYLLYFRISHSAPPICAFAPPVRAFEPPAGTPQFRAAIRRFRAARPPFRAARRHFCAAGRRFCGFSFYFVSTLCTRLHRVSPSLT